MVVVTDDGGGGIGVGVGGGGDGNGQGGVVVDLVVEMVG